MKRLEGVGGRWMWNPDSLSAVIWCFSFTYCLVSKFPPNNLKLSAARITWILHATWYTWGFYACCNFFPSQVGAFLPSLRISPWLMELHIDNFHAWYVSLSRVLGIITNRLLVLQILCCLLHWTMIYILSVWNWRSVWYNTVWSTILIRLK